MLCESVKQQDLVIVNNLEISHVNSQANPSLVKKISFNIRHNEVLAVVGESGSGKSLTALAIMGLLNKRSLEVVDGQVWFESRNLLELSDKELREIRAKDIAMVFQEPMTALNPTMRCGKQVYEIIELHHRNLSAIEIRQRVLDLFSQVGLPDPIQVFSKYPHELSGGQKQRIVIAMAICCNPKLLIADEPTTALDVTVQKQIIELLLEIQKQTKMSVLFISHDLSLVQSISDRVLVMYRGDIVELEQSSEIFSQSSADYTKALIAAKPPMDRRLVALPTVEDFYNKSINKQEISNKKRKQIHLALYSQEPILQVKNVVKDYISSVSFFKKKVFRAIDNISFDLYPGETLGLVGESGCGKSTLGNLILRLTTVSQGQILYKGKDLIKLSDKEFRKIRKDIQVIFQDPYSSLNPRLTVMQTILEPIVLHQRQLSSLEQINLVKQILTDVGLTEDALNKYPHEFSGGQRQRIGIARALAVNPRIIICDESVSALDISVQAQVLNLLNELKKTYGFSYLFISHDLAVVKYMSDRVMVMHNGKVVEIQEADQLYEAPKEDYTKTLIDSMVF